MRTLLVLGSLWLIPVGCWAEEDYSRTPGTPFDLTELTSEFKRAIPDLEGCQDTQGTLTCRRLTGVFTKAERVTMDAVLSVHDPDIRAKRQAKWEADMASGDIKLKAFGLTDDEVKARHGSDGIP